MIATGKRLMQLTAADLMTHTVMMIPQDMSLPGAARLLSQAGVTGAPVIDNTGHCVGVLSAVDFLHLAEQGAQSRKSCACHTTVSSSWQIVEQEQLRNDLVHQHMTRDPVTVPPTARIGTLARQMRDAHIHRVIVVDAEERPIGIISTMDILAALAHAAELAEPGPWYATAGHSSDTLHQ